MAKCSPGRDTAPRRAYIGVMGVTRWAVRSGLLRALGPVLAPFYSGVGSILVFHRITAAERVTPFANSEVETSVERLREILAYLERSGHEFVGMDEVPERLAQDRLQQRRFAAITFDDGYL